MRKFNIIEVLIELEQDNSKKFEATIPIGGYLTVEGYRGQAIFERYDEFGRAEVDEIFRITAFGDFEREWYEVTND